MEKREVFGTFVADKRRLAGLSQRELADKLHVTESAVSKWERGVSYPDITMISPLSQALEVSDHELMSASDDRDFARITGQAKSYRLQRSIVTWTLAIAYGVALISCFIVNLAINHRLTWFFIVVTSIMVAASVTILPYWVEKRRWLIVLGAFLVSLLILLFTVWVYTGGGWWLLIAAVGVVFGFAVVFGPLTLRSLEPVGWLGEHKMLVCLAVDSALLFGMVIVSMIGSASGSLFVPLALPIIITSLLPIWLIALTIRYLALSGWFKAAISLGIAAVWEYCFTPYTDYLVTRTVDQIPTNLGLWGPFNLLDWSTSDLTNANIRLIITLACLLAAGLTALIGSMSRRRRIERVV